MVVINKKRLEIILGTVMLGIFTFLIANKNINIQNNSIETVALPVTNKVIVVDAGHGVPDEGAQSSNRHNRSPD